MVNNWVQLCSTEQYLLLLEPTRPQSAELLTFLSDINTFQNLNKMDTSLKRTL